MRQKQRRIPLDRANVVGVIHTAGGFAAAVKSRVDAVEVRADALPQPPDPERIAQLSLPAILTVRRHDEGGARPLADEVRLALYLELLPTAAAVDIEGKSLSALGELVTAARKTKATVIVSFHDFQGTPSLPRLRTWMAKALDGGADVVKIASVTEKPGDVARLLTLLDAATSPLAVMGMGTLGRASRLLFARAGSVLNYGWLDKPQVPGQWSAPDLRDLLARA
jgi:3-dehydroquinate dehydratase-1